MQPSLKKEKKNEKTAFTSSWSVSECQQKTIDREAVKFFTLKKQQNLFWLSILQERKFWGYLPSQRGLKHIASFQHLNACHLGFGTDSDCFRKAGWPDWANFLYRLVIVFFGQFHENIHTEEAHKMLATFYNKKVMYLLWQKMGWAAFLGHLFKNSSGHPAENPCFVPFYCLAKYLQTTLK
jgi:hypothetical protein